jgi:outer membrane protein assembly factor BamB
MANAPFSARLVKIIYLCALPFWEGYRLQNNISTFVAQTFWRSARGNFFKFFQQGETFCWFRNQSCRNIVWFIGINQLLKPLLTRKGQVYQYTPRGKVWKMIADPKGSLLVVESRNEILREACLSVICTKTLQLQWQVAMPGFEDPWWTNLHTVSDGVIVISCLQEDTPVQKGVIALDAGTGVELWRYPTMHIVQVGSTTLEGLLAEDERVQHFDLKTGEDAFAPVGNASAPVNPTLLPLRYTAENKHFATFQAFLHQNNYPSPTFAVDYLETGNFLILSYYWQEQGKNALNLLILDRKGTMLFAETLEKELQGIGLAPFFCMGDLLVFTRSKSAIGLVKLSTIS